MDNLLIGLRAQDFHESLKVVSAFGPKDVKFKNTLLVGKAASLAMHLRGLLYVEDVTQLEYAAASLGISSIELPAVLRQLEILDFVSVSRSEDQVKRIDVRVPEFRSGYAELGQRWLDLKPTDAESGGIRTLQALQRGPLEVEFLEKKLSLEGADFAVMTDVMKSGRLVATQTVDGTSLAYSPLAVDGNPTAYLTWAKKFPSEVRSALSTLSASQGLPIADERIAGNHSLVDAIETGVLMPVTVSGATGVQKFVFAPRGGLDEFEKTVLDKARAILSCVRYGQNFSDGTRIRYPRLILERLRDNKTFKRGHPDLMSQYGLLAEKLIGHPVQESSNRWNFRFDDTDENVRALDTAIEMLEFGTSSSVTMDADAHKALLSPSQYQGPASTRARMTRDAEVSQETRADIVRELTKLSRGMQTHG